MESIKTVLGVESNRRIYDITTVLQSIGILEKMGKSEWIFKEFSIIGQSDQLHQTPDEPGLFKILDYHAPISTQMNSLFLKNLE